jgi:hypothetical protein
MLNRICIWGPVHHFWDVILQENPFLPVLFHLISFPSPASMMPIHYFSSTRIMYPSSSYIYGNPGYYYDPLHHPHSMSTQTTGSPYSTRDVPHTPTCMYPTMCPPDIPTTGIPPFVPCLTFVLDLSVWIVYEAFPTVVPL